MQGNWNSDTELITEFRRDLAAKTSGAVQGMITTHFQLEQCWAIVMAIQCALREPPVPLANDLDTFAGKAKAIAEEMITVIATTPAEREFARRNWGGSVAAPKVSQ